MDETACPFDRRASAAPVARRLRHRLAQSGSDRADWRAYAAALAILGFRDRAAQAAACAGDSTIDPSPPPPDAIDRQPVRVFVSGYAPLPDEDDRAALASAIGTAHYSYGFAMRNFLAALALIGVPYTRLRHPEFIPDIRDRSDATINIHLGFYPPEQMRLLKGA